MAKRITAQSLLRRHVHRRERILLVNPPVEDTRYSWLRWNQPLDLLKIAAGLRSNYQCKVDLLDFLCPDAAGDVPEQWLPKDRRHLDIGGERYPMRRFGRPYKHLQDSVVERRAASPRTLPTQVWITNLCSYWFESIAEICRVVRQSLPDSLVVLVGQYPRLMPDHALSTCRRPSGH